MRIENKIRGENENIEFYSEYYEDWFNLECADMSHIHDAVIWWNRLGRLYGPKSPQVRNWMLNPNNYYLEHYSYNRSAGARIRETYLPPANV